MDRADTASVGASLVAHATLFALVAFVAGRAGVPPVPPPMEVSYVDEIGLTSAAPAPAPAPAPEQGRAPEAGAPEDAASEPTPPVPAPRPAPPMPAPRQADSAPSPTRDRASRPDRRQQSAPSQRNAGTGQRTSRPLIGDEILKGIGRDPSPSRSQRAQAAMTGQAAADIGSAILRQVQPCANRQVYPGPGAERIVTTLNLRLNRDGSLAAPPRLVGQRGIDDENRRYAERVADLAIRSFVQCAPMRGLPTELYDVPRGWSNFTMNYRLPG